MSVFRRSTLFMAAIAWAACARSEDDRSVAAATRAIDVVVQGAVRDARGNPIPEVLLRFLVTNTGTEAASATSGADGRYVIAALPDGTYDIEVTPPASSIYVRQTFPAQVIAGDTTFDVVLVSSVTVSGRLLESGGNPLGGQSVCLRASSSTCATTNAAGSFSVAVGVGDYTLSVNGDLGGGSRFNPYSLQQIEPVAVSADVVLGDVVLPTRTLSGLVVDDGGAAVPAASVEARPFFFVTDERFTGYWYGSVTADSDGRFTFTAFDGSGTVHVTAQGRASLSTTVSITGDTDVTLALPAANVVTGRLVDSAGDPLAAQTACLVAGSSTCAITDGAGAFSLAVGSGDFTLRAAGQLLSAGTTYQVYSLDAVAAITVSGDLSLGDVVLPTRTFSGQVVDSGGAVVAGAIIDARPFFEVSSGDFTGYWFGSATTDAAGRFELVAFDSSGTVQTSAIGKPSLSVPVTIAGDTDVTLTLAVSNAVSGRLLDAHGSPLGSQNACLVGAATSCASTDASGAFALAVGPGDYTLRVSGQLGGATTFHSFSLDRRLPITVSGDVTLGDVALPTRLLSGQVLDADGRAVADALVSADPYFSVSTDDYTGYWFGSQIAGADGRFQFVAFPSSGRLTVTPAPESGQASASLSVQITDDHLIGVSVQFLSETVSTPVAAGGSASTDTEGDGATANDPVETALRAPVAGVVTIVEQPITETPPQGFAFLTQQVNITAPQALSADDPIVLDFRIDCSRISGACDAGAVEIFRNGVLVPPCRTDDAAGRADPTPCVESQVLIGDDVSITVLTIAASAWNIGQALPVDRDGDHILDGYDLCPDEPEDLDGVADADGCPDVEPPVVACADFDGDGRVTLHDLRALTERLGARRGQRRYDARFDLDDDGWIHLSDLRLARQQLGQPCGAPPPSCADVDHDGVVTRHDVGMILVHLGARRGGPRYDARYDLDDDGRIDIDDVEIAHRQLGERCD